MHEVKRLAPSSLTAALVAVDDDAAEADVLLGFDIPLGLVVPLDAAVISPSLTTT